MSIIVENKFKKSLKVSILIFKKYLDVNYGA